MAMMRYQPQGRLQLDLTNPITAGIAFIYVLGGSGAAGFISTKPVQTPFVAGTSNSTPIGLGTKASSSLTRIIDTGSTSITTNTYSLFAYGTGTTSGIQSSIDDDDSATGNRRFQFRINSGKVEFIPFFNDSTTTGQVISPTAMSSTDVARGFTMGAVCSPSSTAIFQNGSKTAASTTAGAPRGPSGTFWIGCRKTNGTSTQAQAWTTGNLSLVIGWSRSLTDAEMKSLADNPWQLFRDTSLSKNLRLFLPVSSSSYTLNATQYGFSLSQIQAKLSYGPRLGLTSYSMSLIGEPVALNLNKLLSLNTGSYNLLAINPNLNVSRNIYGNTGSLNLSSINASVFFNRKLVGIVGTVVAQYLNSNLYLNRNLTVSSSAFGINPSSVGFFAGKTLVTSSRSFSITGSATGFTRSLLKNLSSGTFTTGTNSVGFFRGYSFNAQYAGFTLVSNNTKLNLASALKTGTGSVVLSGSGLTQSLNRLLQISKGSFSVNPYSSILEYNQNPGSGGPVVRDLYIYAGEYNLSYSGVISKFSTEFNVVPGEYYLNGNPISTTNSRKMSLGSTEYVIGSGESQGKLGRQLGVTSANFIVDLKTVTNMLFRELELGTGGLYLTGKSLLLNINGSGPEKLKHYFRNMFRKL
jgi:hypothetical protein